MEESELRARLEEIHTESFGWALSCCARDRPEAEDVLQTAYLKILQGRATYQGKSSFKTWLFAVIRYTAADSRRRHWLRNFRLAGYAKEHEGGSVATTPDAEADPGRLLQLLARLPRRQQEVLHLVFYQGMTIEAAAAVMGVSVGSARTHYERGKQRLRGWISSEKTDEI
jgi:RNA polymerase sigma factor (sigma-70 family)